MLDLPTPTRIAPHLRDDAILSMRDRWEFSVAELHVDYHGHQLDLGVFSDALKVDGVRVTVTARCEQLIADELGWMLCTPKVCDLIQAQAPVKLPPVLGPSDHTMGSNRVMVAHSEALDRLVPQGTPPGTLIANVGKDWVLDNSLADALKKHPDRACNYGYYGPRAPYLSVTGEFHTYQQPGTAHDFTHWDWSQVCRLMSATCRVDGAERATSEVLRDPELAGALNVGGALRVLRQPTSLRAA